MRSVHGQEAAFGTGDPEFAGKGGNAPAPISTHGAFPSVGIEIQHFEIQLTVIPYQHDSVRTNSESPVTPIAEQFHIRTNTASTIVHDDKIISCSLERKSTRLNSSH